MRMEKVILVALPDVAFCASDKLKILSVFRSDTADNVIKGLTAVNDNYNT